MYCFLNTKKDVIFNHFFVIIETLLYAIALVAEDRSSQESSSYMKSPTRSRHSYLIHERVINHLFNSHKS